MLCEIYCEKFHEKRISFNDGLSVILGSDSGTNSIGKSTFLLIVDYVFGGQTYSATADILNNIGPHDIFFTFVFNDTPYRFARNSPEGHIIWQCNETYEKLSVISLDEYRKWLNLMYSMVLPELSFRDAVGRYARVYGKNNCDEKHPLHYTPTEKSEIACNALLKLFDQYLPLMEIDKLAQEAESNLKAYNKAQKLEFIASITKSQFDKNVREIDAIATQIEELSSGLEQGLLDVDSTASEEAVYIKGLLSRARRARSRLQSRLNALSENGDYKFSSTSDSFDELQQFFPGVNLAKIDEIEEFHRRISTLFHQELRLEKNKLQAQISEYDSIIHYYENQLRDLIQNPNLSRAVLLQHTTLLKKQEQYQRENDAYSRKQELKSIRDGYQQTIITIRQQQFGNIEYLINDEMSRINDAIYQGSYNAPILHFTDNSYTFYTPDDTGTGIAYKGLVVFDLAVLNLTKLPILVHDSVILKQIADDAIEQIINLYASCGKQVIIALDKQSSYTEKTTELLNDHAVLRLAPGGEELFGISWG